MAGELMSTLRWCGLFVHARVKNARAFPFFCSATVAADLPFCGAWMPTVRKEEELFPRQKCP
jgi:hypothetical protein